MLLSCRFVNREDIDFSSAAEVPGVQTLECVADSEGIEVDYPTKINKMQNVSSITLYVSGNHGDTDTTIITFLGFKGESTNTRHGVVEAVYESKPQAADHKQKDDGFASSTVL
jgi:PITH domain